MMEIGKIYKIVDVPQNEPCENCQPCVRLRMMELGFICGEYIKPKKKQLGVWIVAVLTNQGEECQYIALRNEELNRIVIEEI